MGGLRRLPRDAVGTGLDRLASAVVLMVLICAAPWVVANAPTNVLVLYSNSRLVPGNAKVDRGLRDALAETPAAPVQLFYEYLDSPEFSGEAHERIVIGYLHDKYAGRPPAVLLAFSDAAFDFMLRHRRELFPAAPLVFGVVSSALLQRTPLPPDVIGIPVDYDFAGTIAQGLRWHPKAQRLVIVTGTSPRDREWEARLRRDAPALAGSRRVEFWAGLPTDALLRKLAALEPDTVVFTPGFYADGAGAVTNPGQSAPRIARASGAPVYGPLDTFIGSGVVGGRMASFEDVGRQAGALIVRLAAGEPAAAIERPAAAPMVLHVDWRQVQRFGIDAGAIPGDAVVHFREATFWQRYRTVALVGIAIMLLQAALIGRLLFEHRRRRSAELVAQKQRVELAHASRLAVAGELTASIAHEINQPLAAVQTSADAAELLLDSGADNRDDLRRIVTRIRRDSVRAGDVIRRLRTLLARHAPERRPFDLVLAVEDVVELMATETRRRGTSIELQLATRPIEVAGDRTQIQQVLINLLLNAMDAAAECGAERRTVTVAVERTESQVRVSVTDRGTGFATDDPDKVFDSFYSTKAQGMGLGLSIARTIVETHGGRIRADSRPGQGATLSFELPALQVAAGPPPLPA